MIRDTWIGVNTCVSIIDFFFFKQKTAYEMRISDWSSDVCSSDLILIFRLQLGVFDVERVDRRLLIGRDLDGDAFQVAQVADMAVGELGRDLDPFPALGGDRSEEHTSELQSLMRISYAVFCLKKKISIRCKQSPTIVLSHLS